MNGRILRWNPERGFGFVQGTSGRNFFAHISGWEDSNPPVVGGEISFDVKEPLIPGKKHMAVNMRYTVNYVCSTPESRTLVVTQVVR
jgi:cold shock CspA family protein